MKKRESNRLKIIDKGIEFKFNTLSIKRLFLFGIIIVVLLSFIPIKVLLASDYKTNEYIKSWRIDEEDSFYVEHIHSVELSTVSEMYLINGQDIILMESIFHSFGAGLPATTPYKFELLEDGFRIYDINRKMEYLVYRAGAVRANHKILINGKKYDFLDFTSPTTGVKFSVDKIPYVLFKIREGLN